MKPIEQNPGPVSKRAPTIGVGKALGLVLFFLCVPFGSLGFTAWLVARIDDHLRSEGSGVDLGVLFLLACLALTVIYIVTGHLVMRKPLIRSNEEGKREWCGPPLAEIGIILAIVAILLAIAIPNFMTASTRSPEARAISEIRNLAVNLETYYIDHNAYPPAADLDGRIIAYEVEGATVSAGYVPWMLTTPIAYTSSLPWDPFHRREDKGHGPYRYATNGTSCWIMTSRGPDLDDDIPIEQYPVPGIGGCKFRQFMSQFGGPAIEYDATNGAASSGDILRVGP